MEEHLADEAKGAEATLERSLTRMRVALERATTQLVVPSPSAPSFPLVPEWACSCRWP